MASHSTIRLTSVHTQCIAETKKNVRIFVHTLQTYKHGTAKSIYKYTSARSHKFYLRCRMDFMGNHAIFN